MKKIYLLATALAALVSCTSDDFTGEKEGPIGTSGASINFNMNTPAVTRAEGYTAAGLLNKNFVVFGYKTVSSSPQTVFDNYQVNYYDATGSSAGSTESNSAGWEYVSYKNLPNGVSTNVGVTAFSALTGSGQANAGAIEQTIKYWDFSASAYDFFAYSLGAGSSSTWATASAMNKTGYGNSSSHPGYTLTGTQAQLGTCYISKQKHLTTLSASTTEVDLEFVNFLSKIQLGFYETIPGYSVMNLRFYISDDTHSDYDTSAEGEDGLVPALYGTSGCISTGGTYNISFDSNYDPVVELSGTATTSDSKVLFDKDLSGYVAKEYEETVGTNFIGRHSNAATSTNQITVLPNASGATLTLKMDYTLVSRDKSGETIQVTGATATIPAGYTKWKSNYAYTYIFKISDNTNGQTGSVTGLYPITLDAIVTETTNGSQTTITTVANPSITTYQNAAIANEYSAGNIYVTVGDGSIALTSSNAKLYTATIEAGAAQGLDAEGKPAITEEMVANALTKDVDGSGNYVLTDANSKKLTVSPVASDAADKLVVGQTSIPAADAPGGKELAVNCAKFAAVTDKVYVFEYIYDTDKKAYKVIKVGTPLAVTP